MESLDVDVFGLQVTFEAEKGPGNKQSIQDQWRPSR